MKEMEAFSIDDAPALRDSLGVVRQHFLAAVAGLRPKLHRFCTRMCGSALDGEDVVQETLAEAFYSLGSLRDENRLEPWLFRIAHHKCVDFLRRERRAREDTVSYPPNELPEPAPATPGDDDVAIDEALASLVTELPPKERAAVLLKDVLSYALDDVAVVVDSTVGGVKAALHRGRAKLRELRASPTHAALDGQDRRLFEAYVDCFNRRDWDALRRLIQADARLEVVGAAEGTMLDVGLNYFSNYTALPFDWRFSLAAVDGEPVIVHWRRLAGEWQPVTAVRLWWQDGRVVRIRDYVHIDYLLLNSIAEPVGTA
jgi:RNA polymerase sigma-70 factor, ECF subfamily